MILPTLNSSVQATPGLALHEDFNHLVQFIFLYTQNHQIPGSRHRSEKKTRLHYTSITF